MQHRWSKKTYNNAVSALRLAFEFGFLDHPEHPNPAALLKCLRVRKKDRPRIDPFAIDEAERVIAALHTDWGEAQGNYDEFRFFSGLRPSEQIALLVSDVDLARAAHTVSPRRASPVPPMIEPRRARIGGSSSARGRSPCSGATSRCASA